MLAGVLGASRMSQIHLQVNGEAQLCAAGLSLEQVVIALGHQPRLVVVEFNGKILPRKHWAQQLVVETDVLEIVTIVGGGS